MKQHLLFVLLFAASLGAGHSQTISTFPYIQDFETEIQGPIACTGAYVMQSPGWTNVTGTDNIDWLSDSGGTPSGGSSTGPQTDANPGTITGKYLYTESSGTCGSPNKLAILLSPYFNFTTLSLPILQYSCHLRGATMGALYVDVKVGSNGAFVAIDTIQGNQGNNWLTRIEELTSYQGLDSVQFRFRGVTGTSFTSDMAIDNIQVFQGPPCYPPTAPSVSNITTNSADLSWGSGFGNYEVEVQPFGTPATRVGTVTTQNPFAATGLNSGTNYNFWVRNLCNPNNSAWAGPIAFTTLCGTTPGDSVSTAIPVNSISYSNTGSTANCYTNTIGNASPDVWYRVILDGCATTLSISLCSGTNYDSYLRVYNTTLTEIAFNDDGCNLQSTISNLPVTGGDTVYVVVEGFGSSVGNYTVTINQSLQSFSSSISYPQSQYCQYDLNPLATISGDTTGIFLSNPGLLIDSISGEINLAQSQPGNYPVEYIVGISTCFHVDTAWVEIVTDSTSMAYGVDSICASSLSLLPVVLGNVNGVFSTSSNLALDSLTGEINLTASGTGWHYIQYASAAQCGSVSLDSVFILGGEQASISYPAASVCEGTQSLLPTITSSNPGLFSTTPGLVIDSVSGLIGVDQSVPGNYVITYSVSGTDSTCGASSVVSFEILNRDDATFAYDSSQYCIPAIFGNPVPFITGDSGGVFSGGLGVIIDPVTGVLSLDSMGLGTYEIVYTSAGACPDTSSFQVTIIFCGVGISDTETNNLQVYPVPVQSLINILNTQTSGPAAIRIFDLSGSLVLQNEATLLAGEPYKVSVENLAPGSYILQVTQDDLIQRVQILIQR